MSKLPKSYLAYARNKLIAEAFYLTGDIEKYGSGFLRIRNSISLYPTMEIDFKEIGNGFMVTLSYSKQKTSTNVVENVTKKNANVTNVAENVTENAVNVTNIAENVTEKRCSKILKLISKNNKISIGELMDCLSVTRMTIQNLIFRVIK